jgi:hypothetical protein
MFHAMAIWVLKDGQREGPYEEQDVRELVYEGTYGDSDAAIRDGQFDWTTLGEVLGRARGDEDVPDGPVAGEIVQEAPIEPVTPEELPARVPVPAPAVERELPPVAAPPERVAVVDLQVPFGSMVMFLVKLVLASIPALLILCALAALFWGSFIALVLILHHH